MTHATSPSSPGKVSRPASGRRAPARPFSFLHFAERRKLDRFLASGGHLCLMWGDRKCSTPVRALVAEEGRPLGLVMGHHLDHALSSRFGNSLYSHRSVTLLMGRILGWA